MEDLIKQAFLHVDMIGPHVQAGHYDLIGPNGEIILPPVWDKVIEPDWQVTMHMWPMERAGPGAPPGMRGGPHGVPGGMPGPMRPPHGGYPSVMRGGMRPGGPPPPPMHPNMRPQHPLGPEPRVVSVHKPKKPRPGTTSVLGWMTGQKPAKSKR
jgi:hypothetical protein